MEHNKNMHVAFMQLPIAEKVLFFILASGAIAHHRCWPPTVAEIGSDLERIWNAEKLTSEDLQDPDRMDELLTMHLAKYASDEGRLWANDVEYCRWKRQNQNRP